MSGGSYNYLCHKDSYDILNSRTDLADMRDRLAALGHLDAAKETESLLLIIDAFEVRLDARIDRLQAVWKAVEWYDSCDCSKKAVDKAIEEYRNK